jgi:hypothetical protein
MEKLSCEDCVHVGQDYAGGSGEYFCAHPDIDWLVPIEDDDGDDWEYNPNWTVDMANGCEQYSTDLKDKLL